jgi:hypothetical protein
MSQLQKITEHCKFLLHNFHDAQEYLSYLNSRLSKDSQELFDFGYFPNSKNIELLFSVVPKEDLKSLSLIYSREISDSSYHHSFYTSFFENHPLLERYLYHKNQTKV